MQKKLSLIFDLDGTLWNTTTQVAASWNMVLQTLPDIPYTLTVEDMAQYMGKTMHEIAALAFPNVSIERGQEIMHMCEIAENEYLLKHGGVLYQGLIATLENLAESYPLYIVSNCQKGYIEVFLHHYNLGRLFKGHDCFGNTQTQKGETIKGLIARHCIENAIYIGDTYGDFTAATFAGLPFVHCRYGFGSVPGALYSIGSITQLPALANSIEKGMP